MAEKDVSIVLGPVAARRIDEAITYIERMSRGTDGQFGSRSRPLVPIPKIGKAHDNIAPRTFGAVDMWEGAPLSEFASDRVTSAIQHFNLLDRTITAGKWCVMFGQYIFGAHFPALEIDATLSGSLAPSGTASASVTDYSNGDDPGATVTVHASPMQGTTTIASGKPVYCTWDDRNQFYRVRGWGC